MKNNKKIVDIYTYMPVLRDLLSQGKEVSLNITGNSMAPFLVHGRDQILIAPSDDNWKKGDMAFFIRTNGKYIMHRICKAAPEGYYIVGDAQTEIEGPVAREQIFAVITRVRRKGKWLQKGDFWWDFFEKVWIHIIPFRPIIRKMYSLTIGRRPRI